MKKPITGFLLAVMMMVASVSATPVAAVSGNSAENPLKNENVSTFTEVKGSFADTALETTSLKTPETNETPLENIVVDGGTSLENLVADGETTGGDDEGGVTCYSQIGALGWLLCPATGLLAKGIDSLYGLIEQLLVSQPVTTEGNSPVFVVWTYLRNITNVIFVIFLLVIIYSQVTGLGISNYGIKKALPKLIIVAILVNLSYILCALAVDTSNIIGASLNKFLSNIGEQAITNSSVAIATEINYYDLFATIAGGATIVALGTAVGGGAIQLLLAFIPIIVGGMISVAIGLITISLRQALIVALVVVSPLAFVAFLLPNTENLYHKWFKLFMQMLVFYPMFSLLFGAARLAGWLFMTGTVNALGDLSIILGLGIQILPLFLAIPLMKMSGTALGKVSGALSRLGDRATNATRALVDPYKEAHRAEMIAKASQRGFNPMSGGSWLAMRNRMTTGFKDRTRLASETTDTINKERLDALKSGKRIIGYNLRTGQPIYSQRIIGHNEDGTPIYSQNPATTATGNVRDREMRRAIDAEAMNRQVKLRAAAQAQRTDNMHGALNDYLTDKGISSGVAASYSSMAATNALEGRSAMREKQSNDLADEAFFVAQETRVTQRDEKTGKLLHPEEYQKQVKGNLGYSGFAHNQVTAEGKNLALNAEYNYLGNMFQDFDALHQGNVKRMESYVNNQVTMELIRSYEDARVRKYTDGILACNNVLNFRGDNDKITEAMRDYYNDGNVNIATSDSNRLAMNFMAMKDSDPALGRFGKFINMETWAFTDGTRTEQLVTMDQFDTGLIRIPERDHDGNLVYEEIEDPENPDQKIRVLKMTDEFLRKFDKTTNQYKNELYTTKINLASSLAGTSWANIDRTFGDSLAIHMANITPDKLPNGVEGVRKLYKDLSDAIMPNIINAAPGFASGSEQINVLARVLTGLKPKGDGKYSDTIEEYNDRTSDKYNPVMYDLLKEDMTYRRSSYLHGLTPNNLIYFKSDLWAAYLESYKREAGKFGDDLTLTEDYTDVLTDSLKNEIGEKKYHAGDKLGDIPESDEKAREKFKEIWAYEKMREQLKDQIENLAQGSQNIEIMKAPIRRALKIREKRDEVRAMRARINRARKMQVKDDDGGAGNGAGSGSGSADVVDVDVDVEPGTVDADELMDEFGGDGGYDPEMEGGEFDWGATDWNDTYLEAVREGYAGPFYEWADDFREAHPEIAVPGRGNEWLDNAYHDAVLHGYIGSPEQWARENGPKHN